MPVVVAEFFGTFDRGGVKEKIVVRILKPPVKFGKSYPKGISKRSTFSGRNFFKISIVAFGINPQLKCRSRGIRSNNYTRIIFVNNTLLDLHFILKNNTMNTLFVFVEKIRSALEATPYVAWNDGYGDDLRVRMRNCCSRFPPVIVKDRNIFDAIVLLKRKVPVLIGAQNQLNFLVGRAS